MRWLLFGHYDENYINFIFEIKPSIMCSKYFTNESIAVLLLPCAFSVCHVNLLFFQQIFPFSFLVKVVKRCIQCAVETILIIQKNRSSDVEHDIATYKYKFPGCVFLLIVIIISSNDSMNAKGNITFAVPVTPRVGLRPVPLDLKGLSRDSRCMVSKSGAFCNRSTPTLPYSI